MEGGLRIDVIFRGRVQGVGFRYRTRSIAEGFDVAGYVRNMPDGSVEMVAEGPRPDVEGFLEAVKKRMAGYIAEAVVDRSGPAAGFTGFEIAF
jgi:acylphosphatase